MYSITDLHFSLSTIGTNLIVRCCACISSIISFDLITEFVIAYSLSKKTLPTTQLTDSCRDYTASVNSVNLVNLVIEFIICLTSGRKHCQQQNLLTDAVRFLN